VSCLSFEIDVGPNVACVCDHMEDDFTGRSLADIGEVKVDES
jgi:hypothetical protein